MHGVLGQGSLGLGHPLHGEFLALLGAVEKIKIDQLLVRKAGVVGQKRARCIVPLPCDLLKYPRPGRCGGGIIRA